MRTAKLYPYIPEPQPVKSDYVIACHYYPGWKKGAAGLHNGFEDLKEYPERTPLLDIMMKRTLKYVTGKLSGQQSMVLIVLFTVGIVKKKM